MPQRDANGRFVAGAGGGGGGLRITKWNAEALKKTVEDTEAKRLARAAIFLANEVKKEISTKGVKCGTEDGERSSPGDPPHIECGLLRSSIAHEVDEKNNTARVGTNLKYGKYLEVGTSKMGARPFLRPTLAKNANTIGQILGQRIQGM